MSWKEKRLITILSIILAVLCAAVLVVLSIRYRGAQAPRIRTPFPRRTSRMQPRVNMWLCLTAMAPQRCPSP